MRRPGAADDQHNDNVIDHHDGQHIHLDNDDHLHHDIEQHDHDDNRIQLRSFLSRCLHPAAAARSRLRPDSLPELPCDLHRPAS